MTRSSAGRSMIQDSARLGRGRWPSPHALIVLAAILSASLVLGAAHAQSRSSATINGRTITVVGGSSQSVASSGERTIVMLDGRKILITGGRVVFEDSVVEVGDFTALEIRAESGRFDIFVDGQPVE